MQIVSVGCVRLTFLSTCDQCWRSGGTTRSDCNVFSHPPGAAGGRVPDAAEAAGAAAPYAVGRARLLPQLPHDRPVARPAVLGHGVAPAGRPGGRRPVWPAGPHAAQTGGEWSLQSYSICCSKIQHIKTRYVSTNVYVDSGCWHWHGIHTKC